LSSSHIAAKKKKVCKYSEIISITAFKKDKITLSKTFYPAKQ
jgi:hypothetical protein